jgi:hypothetical protein
MKWMLGAIILAIGACTAQWQLNKEPDLWEIACNDVDAAVCVGVDEPDIVHNSWLISEVMGAMGVFVTPEWRIYLAPVWFIQLNGYTVEEVRYHETIHAVLTLTEDPPGQCASERIAREMTDARYGSTSAENGWEEWYGCTFDKPWQIGI